MTKQAFEEIMKGLVEAHEFAVSERDLAVGIIIHRLNADGTISYVKSEDFYTPKDEVIKEAE